MVKSQEILALGVEQRILMIEQIWDSINTNDVSLLATHKHNLDNRLARYENGETTFFS